MKIKKKKKKKNEDQQEELLRYRNHYRGSRTTKKTPQDRKIKLSDIEFDEEKLRNLGPVMQNRKPKKRRYYNDVNSDDGIESDEELMRTMTRAAIRKLSERRKRLK